jgi:hypothetical protein
MKIFLDDEADTKRFPFDSTWTVVKSYDGFINLISTTTEDITAISLDHDLGMGKTGKDAANAFVEMLMDNPSLGNSLKRLHIHSSNPGGGDNIVSYFYSAQQNGVIAPDVQITRKPYIEGY